MPYRFEIGQPCPPVIERPRRDFDGAFLEPLPPGGMVALLYLSGMRALERIVIEMEPMDVRIVEDGAFVLTLLRFGNTPIIFSMEHDPRKYSDLRSFNTIRRTNRIDIIAVESTKNEVRVIRPAHFNEQLRAVWKRSWLAAMTDHKYSERYQLWLDGLWKRYRDVRRMWKKARPMGHLLDEDHEKRLRYEQTLYTSMVRQIARSERREA